MFRIDDPSAAAALPTPEAAGTEGYWTEGNPGSGIAATLARASFLNMIQEELRNVVTAAGLTPSKTTYNQLVLALRAAGLFTTAAQFDNTTKAATTAFVQAALGGYSGRTALTASTALTAANIGQLVVFNGSTAAQTLTLPPVAGLPDGVTISFQNVASVPVTIKGNAAETVNQLVMGVGQLAPANTMTLGVGDATRLVISVGVWVEQQPVKSAQISSLGCSSQTWQNLTASRSLGTTFTNSTGRPILVAVSISSVGAGSFALSPTISGAAQPGSLANAAGAAYLVKDTFLVPAGATYSVASGGSGGGTLGSWFELR